MNASRGSSSSSIFAFFSFSIHLTPRPNPTGFVPRNERSGLLLLGMTQGRGGIKERHNGLHFLRLPFIDGERNLRVHITPPPTAGSAGTEADPFELALPFWNVSYRTEDLPFEPWSTAARETERVSLVRLRSLWLSR